MEKVRFTLNEQEYRCITALLARIYKGGVPEYNRLHSMMILPLLKEIIKRMGKKHFDDLHPRKNMLNLSPPEAIAFYLAVQTVTDQLQPWTSVVVQKMINEIHKTII